MVSQWRSLAWGGTAPDDAGACLWSPGEAEVLFADGTRLGWQGSGGLFADQGEHVAFLAGGAPEAMSVGPAVWCLVRPGERGPVLSWGAPGGPWQARQMPPGRIVPGGGWVRWRRGHRFAISTLAGAPVSAPMGAINAQPWPDGPGASWWEGRFLYRLPASGKAAVAGTLPGSITGGLIGPGGAAVVSVADELWAIAPGALPVRLAEEAGLAGGRLSHDEALLHTHQGVGRFCLRTGALLEAVSGGEVPVGFAPQALVLDEARGVITTLSGEIRRRHFLPGGALLRGRTLYGPGGGAWDLIDGASRFDHPALSAAQLLPLGSGVLCVLERALVVLDRHGVEERRFVRPSPGAVILEGEQLLFLERGRTLIADLTGTVLGATTPRALDTPPPEPTSRWGLQVDGGVEMGGRRWQWSTAGMLLSWP